MTPICTQFLGCSQAFSIKLASPDAIQAKTEATESPSGGETSIVLRQIQPALAVRGVACLMCHADIRSSVITDFGYGDSWYMGQTAEVQHLSTHSYFNNYYNSWQSAQQIVGTVVVPQATMSEPIASSVGVTQSMSLADFINTPYNYNYTEYGVSAGEGWTTSFERTQAMSLKVNPPSGPKITEKSQILIRAPSDEELLALAPRLGSTVGTGDADWALVSVQGRSLVGFSGMNLAGTQGKQYALATSLDCRGVDLVIRGPLLLRDLKVNADGGCHLYVAGTVFVEGGITYTGSSPDQTLQISSSRAIIMGIGIGPYYSDPNFDFLALRFSNDLYDSNVRGMPWAQYAARVLADVARMGTLRDASSVRPGDPTGQSYSGETRASYDYQGVLFNAPTFHSRYVGQIKGVIIAEIALPALGKFHFAFDPVFTRVPALPALKQDVLVVH